MADDLKDLLDISSETEFNGKIIEPIAEKWAQTGRCMDAVYAYSLSRVSILTKKKKCTCPIDACVSVGLYDNGRCISKGIK